MDFLGQAWVFWIVAGVLAACGLVLVYRGLWRDRARGMARCAGCWYDLRAMVPAKEKTERVTPPVTCPECGRVMTKRRRLYRTRRHYRVAMLGLLIIGLSLYSYEVRHRLVNYGESWKTAVIPSTAYIAYLPWTQEKATFELIEGRFLNRVRFPLWGEPKQRGFWSWQERWYQSGLSALVKSGNTWLWGYSLDLLQAIAHNDDHALRLFASHLDHSDSTIRLLAMQRGESLGRRLMPWRNVVYAGLDGDDMLKKATGHVIYRMGPKQFDGLSDERLCHLAERMMVARVDVAALDWILSAMVRSGLAGDGPAPAVLLNWLRKYVAAPTVSEWDRRVPANLELVTALRRLERREDPLTIEVHPAELRGKAGRLPMVKAVIRNVDGIAIGFREYGDSRGGRPMRWRFDVRSVDGQPMPVNPEADSYGGKFSFRRLERDQTFEIELDLQTYMSNLPAGEYRVVVEYHNSLPISRLNDVSRLIVTRSKVIPLVVEP